jgi:hypothetical protein
LRCDAEEGEAERKEKTEEEEEKSKKKMCNKGRLIKILRRMQKEKEKGTEE